MNRVILLSLFASIIAFQSFAQPKMPVNSSSKEGRSEITSLLQSISKGELEALTYFIASDEFEGRRTGSKAERAVAMYLASQYKALGIGPAITNQANDPLGQYLQVFPLAGNAKSQNVLAYLEGSDPKLKNEVVIICSHYDHLGVGAPVQGDSIFNGAADDASGTAALLEIAETFMDAKELGLHPMRSVLFLHAGAEERGLQGSSYYASINPVIPLERVVAVLNMDGVGGTDKPEAANKFNYVYLLNVDSTSMGLAQITSTANKSYGVNLDILKPQNPERFGSDSRPFEFELVPTLFFSTGLTQHYHQVSDNPNTIDYQHMEKIVRLIFSVGWELTTAKLPVPAQQRSAYKKSGTYMCPPCGCGLDDHKFEKPGVCPNCNMAVTPVWVK